MTGTCLEAIMGRLTGLGNITIHAKQILHDKLIDHHQNITWRG